MGSDEPLVLTRRRALQAGAAGAAAAYLLTNPLASAAVAASKKPSYLRRSSWLRVADPMFKVGNTTLRLDGVADLPAASQVRALRDSEDAFALVFSGRGVDGLEPGIHELRHSELGSFYMYVGQVGAPGQERLEVVVNRVVGKGGGRRAPRPRSSREANRAAAGQVPGAELDSAIRSVTVKRGRRGARCVVKLDRKADVQELTTWLSRGERVVAATTRKVKRSRVEFSLKTAKRLRKGGYEIVLMATEADGERSYKRKRVKLR